MVSKLQNVCPLTNNNPTRITVTKHPHRIPVAMVTQKGINQSQRTGDENDKLKTYNLNNTCEPWGIPSLVSVIGGPKHFELGIIVSRHPTNPMTITTPSSNKSSSGKNPDLVPTRKPPPFPSLRICDRYKQGIDKAYLLRCLSPVVECGWSSKIFSAQWRLFSYKWIHVIQICPRIENGIPRVRRGSAGRGHDVGWLVL